MRHYLNGIEINPVNRTEIGVVADFTGNPDVLSINIDSIKLKREAFDVVQQWIDTNGLFHGIPYQIQMDGSITLEYFVDLTDGFTVRDHECEIKIKRRKGRDNFKEIAAGTSFEYLNSKGVVFSTIDIPYYIVSDDQMVTAITLTISTYFLTEQVIAQGQQVVEAVSEVIQAVTPSVGLGVVMDTGDIIVAVLKAIARIVYFALLLSALLNMVAKLFVLVFPPERKMKGVRFKELATKACNYLGYTFNSSLLDNEPFWTVCPVPLIKNRKSIFEWLPDEFFSAFNKGYPSSSDTTPTVGQFFEALEVMFNAKTWVNNGVVRFERRDYFQYQAAQGITPALVMQGERSDEYTFNTDDVWKRYYIHYQTDVADIHTLDRIYDYHDAEFSCEPTTIPNADLVMIKGLQDVTIPFALGARKEKLNWLEKLAKGVFKLIDGITGIFGGGTNYEARIGARINSLMISQNFFTVTKVLYAGNDGRQLPSYPNVVSATALWAKYHYINQIQLNDFAIRTENRLRLHHSEFVNLLNNNYIEIDGVNCEILRVEWIDEKSYASITYRKVYNYADGKVSTLVINL
jgi:hypothetical protein